MRFSLIILSLLLFLSCSEELEYNPLDPENNPDFVEPDTEITMAGLEGSILDTSTVTVTWQGNDLVEEYSYSLNDDWSQWSSDTSVTLNYLDEGDYIFSVKGRYESGDEDTTPATVSFTVDMVGAKGIRVYPLMTKMSVDSTADVHIYAEEVNGLVFFSFQIQFDPDSISIDVEDIVRGELISGIADYAFLPKEISAGLIEVSFTALGSSGISGAGSLATLPFSATGSSTLQIINPEYGYIDGSVEPVTESVNGMVVVQ